MTALIPGPEDEGGPTENRLRVAGETYPAGIVARYGKATVPAGTFATEDVAGAPRGYRRACSRQPLRYRRRDGAYPPGSPELPYDPDVRDRDCGDLSIVDCFAAAPSEGYCEYYATTMAMMLRELGIPARYVKGFLPGDAGPEHRDVRGPEQGRPRLGPGLLPGPRLDHLRSHRRRAGRALATAVRPGRSERHTWSVVEREQLCPPGSDELRGGSERAWSRWRSGRYPGRAVHRHRDPARGRRRRPRRRRVATRSARPRHAG